MSSEQITEFITSLPGRYKPASGGKTNAAVQFHFTGANASDWTLEIDGPVCRTAPGTLADPSMTLTMDSADFQALLSGKLQPMQAFMQGRMKLKGDLSLAMGLAQLFRE